MRLLVHVCCADCGLKLMDAVHRDVSAPFSYISTYFYNPNIHPESEHMARQKAVQKVFGEKGIQVTIANWTPSEYFSAFPQKRGNKSAFDFQKRSDRCPVCWELRLDRTFGYAKKNGFTHVTSTLLSSAYHDPGMVSRIGIRLAKTYGLVMYLPQSVDHCLPTSGFYKQNYEGCVFSLLERMKEKYSLTGI